MDSDDYSFQQAAEGAMKQGRGNVQILIPDDICHYCRI